MRDGWCESKTSAQNVRSSYWHGYPERHSHTASRRTRMPATHQRKLFAAPIGTATPNDVYTQQAAKPRMAGTHQNKIFASSIVTASTQKFRSSYMTAATQICHTDTSSANANITAATQICHTDTASANANIATATQICHADTSSQYNYGDKDTSAANTNITAATSRPGPSGDTARRRPFYSGSGYCACHTEPLGPSGDTARRRPF